MNPVVAAHLGPKLVSSLAALFPNIARYLRMLRDAPECFFSRRRQNLPEESDAEPLFEPSLFAGKSPSGS